MNKVTANPVMFAVAASLGVGVQLLTTSVIKATSATSLKAIVCLCVFVCCVRVRLCLCDWMKW